MEQRGIDLPDPEGRAEWRSRGVPESSGLAWASRSTLRGTRSVECRSQGVRYASPLDSPRPVTEASDDGCGSLTRRDQRFRAGHDTSLPEAKSLRRDDGSGQAVMRDVASTTHS